MYMSKGNKYHIPIRFNPKYGILMIFTIIYFNLCIFAYDYLVLFYKPIIKSKDIRDMLLILVIMMIFSLLILYINVDIIHSLILKRQYVEINHEGIIIKRLFRKIVLKWSDIYVVEKYSFRMAYTIRITRKKDIMINIYLRTFGTWFGLFYIDIKNQKYKNIDIIKFLNTIEKYIR